VRSGAIAFLIGIVSLQTWEYLPSVYLYIPALVITAVAYFLLPQLTQIIWRFLIIALLGLLWAQLHVQWQLANQLPTAWVGQDVLARGYIASLPEHETYGLRLEFKTTQIQLGQQTDNKEKLLRLTWSGRAPALHVGEQWQLLVRLQQPHGNLNSGDFDYEQWLFAHQVVATGYVKNSAQNSLLKPSGWNYPVQQLRQFYTSQITQLLQGNPVTGFITGLCVGVRTAITVSQWQTLRDTGTNHLFAIAGLHIGLIAGWIFLLTQFIWRRFTKLTLHIPANQVAALTSLIVAVLYSALAGFSLPTQRAVIMLAVFLMAVLWRRYLPPWTALLLAVWIILLLDPFAILSASFWLSFTAVAIIIYGSSGRLHWQHKWWHWARLQWIIALGLFPLSLLFFQQVSMIGVIANMIAIPWVGFVVLPLCFFADLCLLMSPTSANYLLHAAAIAMTGLWWVLEKLAALPGAEWYAALDNTWLLCSAFISIFLLLAPRGLPARYLGMVWLLPIIFWQPNTPEISTAQCALLDTPRGVIAVVRTHAHNLVYVSGIPLKNSDDNETLASYLRSLHVKSINKFVQTGTLNTCIANQSWQWDGVTFTFLNSSCVLKITAGQHSVLFTGDLTPDGEQALLKTMPSQLQATILQAPHHNSVRSSSEAFIQAVNPTYVLFASGHPRDIPKPAVIARYAQHNIVSLDTFHCGEIRFLISARGELAQPQCYRLLQKNYWNQ
jgi:competence protein ComEC